MEERIREYLIAQGMDKILLNLAVQELTALLGKALPGDQLEIHFSLVIPDAEGRTFMEAVRGKDLEHNGNDLSRN